MTQTTAPATFGGLTAPTLTFAVIFAIIALAAWAVGGTPRRNLTPTAGAAAALLLIVATITSSLPAHLADLITTTLHP